MTALEMQQLFETELQSMSQAFNDLEKPDTDTIFRYINDYQKEIVKVLYQAKDYWSLKKIISDTAPLVLNTDLTINNSVYYTFVDGTTPKFLYYITSRSKYDRTLPELFVGTEYVYNEEILQENYNQFITTQFNKPFFRVPKCYIMDNTLSIISDAYTTITGVIITYVKNPVEIGIGTNDCELDESLHREIVIGALQLFIQQKTALSSKSNKE